MNLHRVAAALSASEKSDLHGSRPTRKKRTISVAGAREIAAAQRARWAKDQGAKGVPISSAGTHNVPAARKGLPQPRKRAGKVAEGPTIVLVSHFHIHVEGTSPIRPLSEKGGGNTAEKRPGLTRALRSFISFMPFSSSPWHAFRESHRT